MQESEQSISTLHGNISFDEFYYRTKRIVANKLKQHGISDPEDIEDCLQSAYLKVWQQIESSPQIFADKPLSYIIQSLFFASKVQRFSHKRHFNKVSFSTTEQIENDSISIQQIETWIDLQSAIAIVANTVLDNEYALFAMYTILTQATVADVQPILKCSNRTITKYRKQIREQLAEFLPHYNHIHPDNPEKFEFLSGSVAIAILDTSSV